MRRIGIGERRARLGVRHHLAATARAGLADDPVGWVEEVGTATVKALEARGGATATEVAKDDPRLRHPPLPHSPGTGAGGLADHSDGIRIHRIG